MLANLFEQYAAQVQTLSILLMLVNVIIHIIFAGAVARDAGIIHKMGLRPALVSASTWAFATLLGGVFVAAIYWFIHHSNITRPITTEADYDKK